LYFIFCFIDLVISIAYSFDLCCSYFMRINCFTPPLFPTLAFFLLIFPVNRKHKRAQFVLFPHFYLLVSHFRSLNFPCNSGFLPLRRLLNWEYSGENNSSTCQKLSLATPNLLITPLNPPLVWRINDLISCVTSAVRITHPLVEIYH